MTPKAATPGGVGAPGGSTTGAGPVLVAPPTTTPTPVPFTVARAPLTEVLPEVADFHDRLGIEWGAHARTLALWAEHTGRPITAVLVRGGHDAGLRAAALLCLRTVGPPSAGLADVTLAGHGWSDLHRMPAVDGSASAALASAIADLLRGHRGFRARLDQVPASDLAVTYLAASGLSAEVSAAAPVPVTRWPSGRTEAGWARKKTRHATRLAGRRATEAGLAWEIDRLTRPTDITDALPETLQVRRARELAQGRRDHLARRDLGALHHALVRAESERGRLELWRLRVGGRLECYLVAVRDGDAIRLLDSRMRPDAAIEHPGTILFGQAMQTWHADPGISTIDFGRGLTDFKRGLRTEDIATTGLTLWSDRRVADAHRRAAWGAESARRRARALRARSPWVASRLRSARRLQNALAGLPRTGRGDR